MGSIGVCINFIVYYLITRIALLSIGFGAIGAFGVAVICNYILNHKWTFSNGKKRELSFERFLLYVLVNLIGLFVNVSVLSVLVAMIGLEEDFLCQGVGVLCGMLLNFYISKKLVFEI
ncbi:GtrA family protein [Leeia sp.]|uniref:GtrA family protein n=1 Tax=Leeia sp. TaxID=2884678 RepID=UPI0035ADE531